MRAWGQRRFTRKSTSRSFSARTAGSIRASAGDAPEKPREAAAAYCKRLRLRLAPATVQARGYMLGAFLRHCERVKADYREVNRHFIEHYLLSLPVVRDRRREIVTALRGFYDFLGTTPNPALEIVLPRPVRKRLPRMIPAAAQIFRIAADIGGMTEELALRNRLLVELAYGSGLRRGELRGLDVGDVDLHAKTAFVTGKGNRSRNVPLTDKSVELLRRYLALRHASRGPLLASLQNGRRLSVGHISKLFHRKTGYNTHAFRHACASHMLREGCNLRAIQELLGHGNMATTQLYTHLDKSALGAVIETAHPRAIVLQ